MWHLVTFNIYQNKNFYSQKFKQGPEIAAAIEARKSGGVDYLHKELQSPHGSTGQQLQEKETGVNSSLGNSLTSHPCLDLQLAVPAPTEETKHQEAAPTNTTSFSSSPQLWARAMVYNHIDPTPFVPRGFERVEILGRATMVRTIGGQPHAMKTWPSSPSTPYRSTKSTSPTLEECSVSFLGIT